MVPQATGKMLLQQPQSFPRPISRGLTVSAHCYGSQGMLQFLLRLVPSAHKIKFLCDCIEHQPNTALSELQAQLRAVFMVEASVQTISQALQREGYTMKTVHGFFSS